MPPKNHSEPGQKKHQERLSRAKLLFLVVLGAVILTGGCATAYSFYYANRFLPHTEISGIAIGGLTREEATGRVQAALENFQKRTLHAQYAGKQWDFSAGILGSTIDTESALATIWAGQKSGMWQHGLEELARAPLQYTRQELNFSALSKAGDAALVEAVLHNVETPNHETSLAIAAHNVTIVPGAAGQRVDRDQLQTDIYGLFKHGGSDLPLTLQAFQPQVTADMAKVAQAQAERIVSGDWSIALSPTKTITLDAATVASWLSSASMKNGAGEVTGLAIAVDADAVKKLIATWSAQVDQVPSNARLQWDGSAVTVVQDGKAGFALNVNATADELALALRTFPAGSTRSYTAHTDVAQPPVRKDTLASLGLTQRIGTNTTDFSGSPVNRKANIALGQQKLDGKLVLPGETFSTIGNLGPITTDAGFLNELVIKDNRTKPEAGGGLCQVSTTLFRSVLNAGLSIVERANHSYRVGYYERGVGPGLDATIYDPKPDFRWKNDLASAVYVQSSVKGTTITFDLYGTNDGRTSVISPPTILEETPSGDPIYIPTDTVDVGQQKQVETAHGGAKTVVTYTVTKDGKQYNQQTFRSTYKPWPAQYMVGTRPVASSSAEPTSAP